MSSQYLFTTLILGIGSLHLLWRGIETIRGWLAKKADASLAVRPSASRRRDDWYIFFHRSVLYGEKSVPSGQKTTGTRAPSRTTAKRPVRRRTAPRLHLL